MTPNIFVDANILIYATIAASPFHLATKHRLDELAQIPGAQLWVSRQVVREYLKALLAQSSVNSLERRQEVVTNWEETVQLFEVTDEDESVAHRLGELARTISFPARNIHDANIVATMLAYGIDTILTNDNDFEPFAGLVEIIRLKD